MVWPRLLNKLARIRIRSRVSWASEVEALIGAHVSEYFRLLAVPSVEQERKRQDFVEAWPFAPHLLQLLEDQVLIAIGRSDLQSVLEQPMQQHSPPVVLDLLRASSALKSIWTGFTRWICWYASL